MQFLTRWYECEHQGDLDMYAVAVRQAGGTAVKTGLRPAAEEGVILVEAPDQEAFLDRLAATEIGEFCYEAFRRARASSHE